jgi:AbrB family looped-hinge helix DNA binding protein
MTVRVTTRISTKGQVVLPKAVREEQGFRAGDRLVVESTANGVTLRRASVEEAHTRLEDVAGCLGPAKRVVSINEMNSAVGEYVRKHWGHEYDDID